MQQQNVFKTSLIKNQIVLKQSSPIRFSYQTKDRIHTYIRAGLRIGATAFDEEKKLHGKEGTIIKQIHNIRYSEKNPYVITGGHFYQIFVRNLGVFFNALLDPRISSSENDWYLRQSIALRTIAHDLETFRLAKKEFTTITPLTKDSFTGLNIYARPSDSLHAIVYTLNALIDDTFIRNIFPSKLKPMHKLQTKTAANKLLKEYKDTLENLLCTYKNDLLDPETKLIKKDLLLSSARDGIKRKSSFYDNVILWATLKHAASLKLFVISDKELLQWKERIIKAFWNKKDGCFYGDIAKENLFSADSFIVTSTQFLNISEKRDREYLLQMVSYVKQNKLDQPFPLHYSTIDQLDKLYRAVRIFAPSYMGTSIWSHWGMEYIKTLLFLAKYDSKVLIDAEKHLKSYKNNIEKYGGYPEVYDKDGKILRTRLYRSVLHNGWVINYEQVKMLLKNI